MKSLVSLIYDLDKIQIKLSGCFDLLLDAEKCKYGIEIQSTMGPDLMSGTGMFFGAGSTPSTLSPSRTPWMMSGTPQHVAWSPNNPGLFDKPLLFCDRL